LEEKASVLAWLHARVARVATWPAVALLFLAFLACTQAFQWRQKALGHDHELLDVRRWYTPGEAQKLLDDLGPAGRRTYAVTQLTLDVVFPLVYGALVAALTVRLYPPGCAWLLLAPALAVTADLLENVTTAYLAWTFAGPASGVAWAAAVFTLTKSAALVASLGVLFVGGVRGLWSPIVPG
jgi:hypothetical protein